MRRSSRLSDARASVIGTPWPVAGADASGAHIHPEGMSSHEDLCPHDCRRHGVLGNRTMRARHYTPENEWPRDTSGQPDAAIGDYVDATGNDALTCQECGASGVTP